MFKALQKHPKVIIGILVVVTLISVLSYYQKQQYLKNPYANQLETTPRADKALDNTFYYEQLTDKEKTAYEALRNAMENFQGGVFTFPEALTGKEYSRVTQALECGNEDFFYGMVEVPMNEANQNVTYKQSNVLNITDAVISKCMLFLYPAQGLDTNGEIDDEGYVTNLEALAGPLSTMDADRVKEVEEITTRTKEILEQVVAELPAEYDTKKAIDYFLQWMDVHLTLDEELMESTSGLSTMSEVFTKVYYENHCSCVVEGKAMAAGYSKVLTYLCNAAGIDAHVVFGTWKSSNAYTLTCVDFTGTPVFIDASRYKNDDLWNQRYISQTLAAKYMTFSGIFESVR